MFCPKCNKFYYRKTYFNKHINLNNCIKNIKINKIENNISKSITELLLAEINLLKNRINDLEKLNSQNDKKQDDQSSDNLNDCTISKIDCQSNDSNDNICDNTCDQAYDNLEQSDTKNNPNKEIKNERINIPIDVINQYLSYKDIESDVELLGKYYFEGITKENHPIKRNKKNDCYFWNGSDWIEDNGTNLKSIISNNLRKLYTKINVISDNITNNSYLDNQEHINQINTKKYQMKLYTLFLDKYCGRT